MLNEFVILIVVDINILMLSIFNYLIHFMKGFLYLTKEMMQLTHLVVQVYKLTFSNSIIYYRILVCFKHVLSYTLINK